MGKEGYSSDSDEDYIPEGADLVLPSEEESDGEPEENVVAEDNNRKRSQTNTKRKPGNSKKFKTKESDENEETEKKPVNEEEEKKKSDSLWADFMKDTDFKPKSKIEKTETKISEPTTRPKVTVTVTKVFEFAGEEVRVKKEVPVNSAEARICSPTSNTSSVSTPSKSPVRGRGRGRGLGGISSVLNQIGRKQKISTLEKSKLDWDQFKKEEKIEEELQSHNKGKNGYLERQDFLERADLRQFEKEKEIRATQRSHRL